MRNLISFRVRDDRGVTVVELLVVMLLMTVIGGIATTSLVRSMQVNATTQARFDALAELQRSVNRMTRELRAGAPLQVGGAATVIAQPDRVSVNVFRNNFTERRRYTYTYCPARRAIYMQVEGPAPAPVGTTPPAQNCASPSGTVLISAVTNDLATQPVFTYTNNASGQVRRIDVRVRRAVQNLDPIEVRTMVRLRNVR